MFRIKRRLLSVSVLLAASLLLTKMANAQQNPAKAALAEKIQTDTSMDSIQASAIKLLSGFSAGTVYDEVWIRDFNTFIRGSLKAHPATEVRQKLLMFFKIQGKDGNIVDGLVDSAKAHVGYNYRYSKLLPGYAAHKNTVETDQESSLIQAVRKYVDQTGDRTILDEVIDGKTVSMRMQDALEYVHKERWSPEYGLVNGATTIDWGDVQPETGWGVAINQKTKWAIDIYDNAMYSLAIRDFLAIVPASFKSKTNWNALHKNLKMQVRKHLWMAKEQKYLPHIYLNGSPFPADFKEKNILYTGGSICAVLAGFNSKVEVKEINRQLLAAAAHEKFASIGITVYPPYPKAQFPNMAPYFYQNAGDWTWFGARWTGALLENGMPQEAYDALKPMLARVIANHGFYEWYNVQTGKPSGSGNFRGEAGVLFDAITELRDWANSSK